MAACLALWFDKLIYLLGFYKIGYWLLVITPLTLDYTQRVVNILEGVEESDFSLVWNLIKGLHAVLEVDLSLILKIKVKAKGTHFVIDYPLSNVWNF
jgi:hypothetical protein